MRAGWARSASRRSLTRQHYGGRQKPAQLLAKLRRAPEGRVGEVEMNARRQIVLCLVQTLRTLSTQIKTLDRQIEDAVRAHPDGEIFLSLFKDPNSFLTAAEMLAEIGDCRGRYPARDALAGDAGQAAVAIESGKRKTACFRWGCNKRLRSSFSRLADTTRHWHPWAADLYAAALARGHDHPRALRTVGRAWCRIVWRCWQDGTPYDPARHRALQRHITVTIPTPSAPCPTQPPPSGCSAKPSPEWRPAGPSAKRLTASRHPLPRSALDTGRLHRRVRARVGAARGRCRGAVALLPETKQQPRPSDPVLAHPRADDREQAAPHRRRAPRAEHEANSQGRPRRADAISKQPSAGLTRDAWFATAAATAAGDCSSRMR